MAGPAYSCLLAFLLASVTTISRVISNGAVGLDPGELAEGALMLLAAVLFASVVGGLYAGLTLVFAVAPVYLMIRILGIRSRQTPITCFLGGFMAVAAIVWVWIPASGFDARWQGFDGRWLVWFLMLPGLATLFGQFGSGYLVMDDEVKRGRRFGKFKMPQEPSEFQFRLWQLLLLMALASGLLTLLRATGVLTVWVLLNFLVWLGFQWVTLKLNVYLIDWLYSRRLSSLANRSKASST